MDLLILGGTVFVGRGAAEAALARGHRVTLFHRGSKGTGIVPGAEEIFGDRDGGLDALKGRRWDAVIDACGYVPRLVSDACQALRDSKRYLFVSTISVYEEAAEGGLKVRDVREPIGTEAVTGSTYGPLKVECEREVEKVFGERMTIIRPGLVYGPYDPTNRFPYWVRRFLEGGEVLVPDRLDAPLQQINAKDLGLLMIRLLEQGKGGVFDAVGESLTFGDMIEACQKLNLEAQPIYASEEALARHSVKTGADLPLVYSGSESLMKINPNAALTAGLQRRSLRETTLDTAEWIRGTKFEEASTSGLTREREREILEKLRPV